MFNQLVPGFVKENLKQSINNYVDKIIQETKQELQETKQELQETKTLTAQYISILHQESSIIPPPPKKLQQRVVGDYSPNFISSGLGVYSDFDRALNLAGKQLKDFKTILDFGCGCGRVIRTFKSTLPESNLFGTDIDHEAIEWLNTNYSRFATFLVAPHLPPLNFEDCYFDFIYGISVFTHLPEDLQFLWLQELQRLAKPGAYLILTTHGDNYAQLLDKDKFQEFSLQGFYFHDIDYGQAIGLPDFYQNTYHSHDYLQNRWSKYFKIISIQSLGVSNHQDLVLLQKQ
jgi:SAM-dependent methyltransferase